MENQKTQQQLEEQSKNDGHQNGAVKSQTYPDICQTNLSFHESRDNDVDTAQTNLNNGTNTAGLVDGEAETGRMDPLYHESNNNVAIGWTGYDFHGCRAENMGIGIKDPGYKCCGYQWPKTVNLVPDQVKFLINGHKEIIKIHDSYWKRKFTSAMCYCCIDLIVVSCAHQGFEPLPRRERKFARIAARCVKICFVIIIILVLVYLCTGRQLETPHFSFAAGDSPGTVKLFTCYGYVFSRFVE